MRNQHEHLTSLIVSFMARNGGDYDRAVLDLHAKLLGGAEKWRESVRSTQAQSWVSSTFVPESGEQNPWIKMHTPRDPPLRSRTDAAGVVTEGGTYGKWVHLSTVQMEEVGGTYSPDFPIPTSRSHLPFPPPPIPTSSHSHLLPPSPAPPPTLPRASSRPIAGSHPLSLCVGRGVERALLPRGGLLHL